ncbi:hypothetical protein MBANPS3_004840 [Mucor bainieri]
MNNTTTKVMRVGSKLYCPILLPNKTEPEALSKLDSLVNTLDMALLENTSLLEQLKKASSKPFVIERNGHLETVCSPYAEMAGDCSLTLHTPLENEAKPLAKCPSFQTTPPSLLISESAAMFSERLFGGLSTMSFSDSNISSASTTKQPAANNEVKQPTDDIVVWDNFMSFKEDDSMDEVNDFEEESGFSVISQYEEEEKEKAARPVKKKTSNAGNILKKSRKNHDPKQTNILMDWYLQNDGKTPSSQGKADLAKATNLNIVQVSTWFQNRKRRYLDTLNEYQALSKRYPDLVYNYQSYKSFIASEKSSHKKKRK